MAVVIGGAVVVVVEVSSFVDAVDVVVVGRGVEVAVARVVVVGAEVLDVG
jgi:hypothetical protein